MPGKEGLPPGLHELIEANIQANETLAEWLVRVSEYPSVEAITNRRDKLFWEIVTAVRRLDLEVAAAWARELYPGKTATFYEVLCQNLIDEVGALRQATVEHAKFELRSLQEEIQRWLGVQDDEHMGIDLEFQPELVGAQPESLSVQPTSLSPRADTLLRIIMLLNSTPTDRGLAQSLLLDLFPEKNDTFYEYCVDDLLLLPDRLRAKRAPDIERIEDEGAELLELWNDLLRVITSMEPERSQPLMADWQEIQQIYEDAWYDFQTFRYNEAYTTAEEQYQAAVDTYFLDGPRLERHMLEAVERLRRFQDKIQGN